MNRNSYFASNFLQSTKTEAFRLLLVRSLAVNVSDVLSAVLENIDIDGKMPVIRLATGNTGMFASKLFI